MTLPEQRVCWYCGSVWRSAAAHAELAADGGCLLCGFDLDHWQLRQEAVEVFEGPDLRLARWNEASDLLTQHRMEELCGWPAREIFAGTPEILQALDVLGRRPGKLLVHAHHTLRTTGEATDLSVHLRALAPAIVVLGALPVRAGDPVA